MSDHLGETLLNDYVDDQLPDGQRIAAESHLAGCAACRAEVDALRALLRQAAGLPPAIEPERDLWGGIAARIRNPDVVPLAGRRSSVTLRQAQWWLAAAALLLVGFSSALTLAVVERGPAQRAQIVTTTAADSPVRFAAAEMEREYRRAIGGLLATLDTRRDELSPATVEVLEENLRIIDQAITDVRAALEADPASRELVNSLADTYQSKVDLLQRAVRLPAQS